MARRKQKVRGFYKSGGYYSKEANQGSQLERILNQNNQSSYTKTKLEKLYYDLNVPYPRSSKKREQLPLLLNRFKSTGFSVIALTHTVFGRVQLDQDNANKAIPFPAVKKDQKESSLKRKCEQNENEKDMTFGLAILKRLNIILEDLSDLAQYTTMNTSSKSDQSSKKMASFLQSYDIISFTPRTETIFSALSNSLSTPMDILTIDYSFQSSTRLPYVIRNADVTNFTRRGIAFEINYGPAIVDPTKRKLWIMAAKEIKRAYDMINIKERYDNNGNNPKRKKNKDSWIGRPKILLSSGTRTLNGIDLGAMALRSPNDMMNVCQVALGWDDRLATKDALCGNPAYIVQRGLRKRRGRRLGVEDGSLCVNDSFVEVITGTNLDKPLPALRESLSLITKEKEMKVISRRNDNQEKSDEEDGFLHFT